MGTAEFKQPLSAKRYEPASARLACPLAIMRSTEKPEEPGLASELSRSGLRILGFRV